jgi:hypothetical protein
MRKTPTGLWSLRLKLWLERHYKECVSRLVGASMTDFYPIISRAVFSSGNSMDRPEARQQVYKRARVALKGILGETDASEQDLARERRALELAIRRLEQDISSPVFRRASTVLLIISVFLFPRLCIADITSMSLYWVARAKLASAQ